MFTVQGMRVPFGWREQITSPPPPGTIYSPAYRDDVNNYPNRTPAGINRAYAPWGRAPYAGELPGQFPAYYVVAAPAYDQRLKDSGVWRSDEWDFPQRKLANEKPKGETIDYDTLIKSWPATPPKRASLQ